MRKRIPVVLGVAGGAMLATMMVGFAVSAQGGPPQGPEPNYGKTMPIHITSRVYDYQKLLAAPVLPEQAMKGRVLWLQKCAYCHDGVGQPSYKTMGPWLGAETLQDLGEDTVRTYIANGDVRMPAFRYEFGAQQMDDMIAFLKTVPSSQKPTAAQLAGKAVASGSD